MKITKEKNFIREAIHLALKSAKAGNDPFGAVLVYKGEIVGTSDDKSVKKSDPTAHAELNLIRSYCKKNKVFSLKGYSLYTSSEPCIMCSGAIYWSGISRVVFSVSQDTLKKYTKGKSKPTCRFCVNMGAHKIPVIGPMLEEEGLKVFDGFKLNRKVQRHRKLFNK